MNTNNNKIEKTKYVFSCFVGYDQDNGFSDRSHEYDLIAYNLDDAEEFVKNREILPEYHSQIRTDGDPDTSIMEIDQTIISATGEKVLPELIEYDDKIHISRTDWVEVTCTGEYKTKDDLSSWVKVIDITKENCDENQKASPSTVTVTATVTATATDAVPSPITSNSDTADHVATDIETKSHKATSIKSENQIKEELI